MSIKQIYYQYSESLASCYGTNFYLTNTLNINLNCSYYSTSWQNGACYQSTIYAQFSNNVIIDCAPYGCVGANFHINNVSNYAIFNFDYRGGSGADIYGKYIQNRLTINCNDQYKNNV